MELWDELSRRQGPRHSLGKFRGAKRLSHGYRLPRRKFARFE